MLVRLDVWQVVLLESDASGDQVVDRLVDIVDLEPKGCRLVGPGELTRVDEKGRPTAAVKSRAALTHVFQQLGTNGVLVELLRPLEVGRRQLSCAHRSVE